MKQFNYKLAYEFLAEPAWADLPTAVLALVSRVYRTAANVGQDPGTLDTEWPVDEAGDHALRAAFYAIPSNQLARAARAVHSAGNWASGDDDGVKLQAHGAYWKFSSYCDQVLRERLGLPQRGERYGHGAHIELHEGYLRLCVSTPYSWEWNEIGPASEECRRSILELIPAHSAMGRNGWDGYAAACKRAAFLLRSAGPR